MNKLIIGILAAFLLCGCLNTDENLKVKGKLKSTKGYTWKKIGVK